jgi:hypothetical protein
MSNGANHNTRNRTVILSEVEGSRKNTADLAAGLFESARNDLTV